MNIPWILWDNPLSILISGDPPELQVARALANHAEMSCVPGGYEARLVGHAAVSFFGGGKNLLGSWELTYPFPAHGKIDVPAFPFGWDV